jgi:predicted XRE-type DNA-binding protein
MVQDIQLYHPNILKVWITEDQMKEAEVVPKIGIPHSSLQKILGTLPH